MSIDHLSDIPLFAARPSRQVPPKRKAAGWITVFIIHLVLINTLIFSQDWVDLPFRHGASTEVTLNLSGATDTAPAPEVRMTVPQAPSGVPPEVMIDPIIIPPTIQQQTVPRPRGGTTEGDLLGALGRDVACSAGHYENLTTAERNRCGHIPWMGARLPNGAIVLRDPEPRNRFAEPAPEVRVSGAEAMQRQLQTGLVPGNCPVLLNVPCYSAVPQPRN